jgi:hypothetical protein
MSVDLDVLISEFDRRPDSRKALPGILGDRSPLLAEYQLPSTVTLDGDWLLWERGDGFTPRVDPREMLDQFVRLRSGTGVERFAQRFGVLAICEHGLPSSHAGTDVRAGCRPLSCETDGWEYCEPVAEWLRLADDARRVLEISYLVYQSTVRSDIGPGRWRELLQRDSCVGSRLQTYDVGAAKLLVREHVRAWLSWGAVSPDFTWIDDRPWFGFSTTDCFGTLAVQLMLTCSKAQGVDRCSMCQEIYFRTTRAPRTGEAGYCPTCRPTSSTLRQRQRRARIKERSADV